MDDEIHFLLRRPSYESIRKTFCQNIKSFRSRKVNVFESEEAVFKILMSQINEIALNVAKFLSEYNKVQNIFT